MTLTEYLTQIADALRTKKGTTDTINAQDFADEILSISGGATPTGKILITTTNEVDVTNYATAQVSDTNLSSYNIRAGKTILGIKGTFTSDATATANDIKLGKTAYVNGVKVEGTLDKGYITTDTQNDYGTTLTIQYQQANDYGMSLVM